MTHSLRRVLALSIVALSLSACGGDGGNDAAPPPPPPPPAAKLEDGFGANFGVAYRADPNSDPADPAATDIIAVNATIDPVDF